MIVEAAISASGEIAKVRECAIICQWAEIDHRYPSLPPVTPLLFTTLNCICIHCKMYFPNCKMYLSRALNVFVSEQRLNIYSLVRLVQPNTEMLISQPFTGLYKIRLLLQDCLTSRYLRFVREQILVNKSDKSDHPHQREPWCFVEVVNKVGAEAMPTKI